jgi:hypothetical protein
MVVSCEQANKYKASPELVSEINISSGKRQEFILPCSCELVAVEVAAGCRSYSSKQERTGHR